MDNTVTTTFSDLTSTSSYFPVDNCVEPQITDSITTDSTMIDDKYTVVRRLDCNEIA